MLHEHTRSCRCLMFEKGGVVWNLRLPILPPKVPRLPGSISPTLQPLFRESCVPRCPKSMWRASLLQSKPLEMGRAMQLRQKPFIFQTCLSRSKLRLLKQAATWQAGWVLGSSGQLPWGFAESKAHRLSIVPETISTYRLVSPLSHWYTSVIHDPQ